MKNKKTPHYRVDRRLLLDLLHMVDKIRTMTGVAAAILAVLQHKLDLSCSSSMDLTLEEDQLHLCSTDCNILCSAIEDSHTDRKSTRLNSSHR